MLAHESRSWRGRLHARESAERPPAPKGRLVEFVRLIFVTLFAAAGYTVATGLPEPTTSKTLVWVVLGTATGFVLGGVLGRQTATAVRTMEANKQVGLGASSRNWNPLVQNGGVKLLDVEGLTGVTNNLLASV